MPFLGGHFVCCFKLLLLPNRISHGRAGVCRARFLVHIARKALEDACRLQKEIALRTIAFFAEIEGAVAPATAAAQGEHFA